MKQLLESLELKAGFWALFDQGAVSLGNFLTQLLLARNLSWNDYGVFALLYGVLFFLVSSLGSMVTYPLSVKGASAGSDGLRQLCGASLWLIVALVLPAALMVLGATAALHRMDLLVFALAALVSWQFQETLRRALMARLRHRDAVWGDSLSYLGQAVWIGVLARTGGLTLQSTLLAVAVTSAVATLLQAIQVRPYFGEIALVRSIVPEFWHLGGWASATNLTNGLTQQAFPWALGLLFGAGDAGSFQAVINPLKVFNPILIGAQNLIVPATAKAQGREGSRSAFRQGLAYAAIGSLLFLPYLVALLIWSHAALGILYGASSPYSHLEIALRLCAFAYVIGYWGDVICSVLGGLSLPKVGFIAQVSGTGVLLVLGLPLILRLGLNGAIVGLGVCATCKAGIAIFAVWAREHAERSKEAFASFTTQKDIWQ